MLLLKNKKLYKPIFSDYARFLVKNTRHDVYFFHLNSEKKKKTLLTNDNLEKYCDKYDLSLKNNVSDGCLFMFVGDLPEFGMHIINRRDETHVIIADCIGSYSDINFDE